MVNSNEKEKQNLIQLASSQQMAAANPDMSVWVEASAGTGKTKVLSDRVLRLLLAKVDPSKILCLTYTKAAAVEMNERIAKRLSIWAVEKDEDLEKDLKGLLGKDFKTSQTKELLSFARTLFALLLDTPGGMKIQTIHSFCQDILKRFPLEAGISPYFEVLDDRNAKEILQKIKLDLLKSIHLDSDEKLKQAILYLTQTISEYKFPETMNMITTNRSKIASLLRLYNNQISLIIPVLEKKLGVKYTQTVDGLKKTFFNNINQISFKLALGAFQQGSTEDTKKAEILSDILDKNFDTSVYDDYKSLFLTDKKTIRSRLATQKVVSIYPDILDFMKSEATRILNLENDIAALNVLHSTIAVLYVAQNIIDNYNAYKKMYAVLDYEDLIVITRQLMENRSVADWVLFKLDGGINHILIDEAQDTSPDQWAIIRAISQEFFSGLGQYESSLERTIFVVGDRKQSIYSFQGADPREFDKMYKYFEQHIKNFSKIHLDVSFRSTKAIMDCVNTLFDVDEDAKKGVIPHGEHIKHQPFRLGDGGQVEILPLLKKDSSTKDSDYNWILPIVKEQKTSLSSQLAKLIAQNIKKMVESKEILASKNRPIQYGDFMFLVQQRNSFVEEFVRSCKEIGVKVAGVDKLKLLEQIAVQDLISLGKFLLLPADDLSLAEVLKSPIFNLNDDDLFVLCHNRSGTLFQNILKNNNFSAIADELKSLLNIVGFSRPFELFSHILINMNGRKNFLSRMGNEVNEILDEFLNLTLAFEQTHNPTLETFISWIEQDEVIIKKEMEQGDSDTVKVMTVHGSKGLQSPIVILADTTRIKNKSFSSEFLWDDGLLYFPTSSACYDDVCKNIKENNLSADFEEYHRLLYVALTRAEDRLYIAGFTKNSEASEQSWYKLLANNIKSNIDLKPDDNRIVYQTAQENSFEEKCLISTSKPQQQNYDYLLTPAPVENPLAKPYTPSHDNSDEVELVSSPLEDNGFFYKRGTVIHTLLQYITTISEDERPYAASLFLEKSLPEFSSFERERIVNEVLTLCQTYKEIFSLNSMAEVPIIGEVDGLIISAKIDRLVILPEKVIIVDYKTNRPAAQKFSDIPEQYIKQMSAYKRLLQKLYPSKQIETYILWTNTCNMMKL